MTLSITMFCHNAVCRYAECHILFIIKLNVVMLNVVMLNVVVPQNELMITRLSLQLVHFKTFFFYNFRQNKLVRFLRSITFNLV